MTDAVGKHAKATDDLDGPAAPLAVDDALSPTTLREMIQRRELTAARLAKSYDWSNYDFSDLDLKYCDLSRLDLSKAVFTRTKLQGADLSYSDMSDCRGLKVLQLGGANLEGAELPESVNPKDGLETASELSKMCRGLFLSQIFACMYTGLTVSESTNADIILDYGSASLPIIETQISVVGFYLMAPILLAGLYVHFHMYLQRLWEQLGKLPAILADGRTLDAALHPWMITSLVTFEMRHLRGRRTIYGRLRRLLYFALAWLAVPGTIYVCWGRSLVRHDIFLSGFHCALFGAVVFGTVVFRCRLRLTIRGLPRSPFVSAASISVTSMIILSILTFVPIRHFIVHGLGPYDADTGSAQRSLDLVHSASEFIPGYYPFAARIIARDAELQARNLRGINLTRADLKGANLNDSDLTEAVLIRADLARSNLAGANLQKTKLMGSNLRGADLSQAILTGADLSDVEGVTLDQVKSACGTGSITVTLSGPDSSQVEVEEIKLPKCIAELEKERREAARMKAAAENEAARRAAEIQEEAATTLLLEERSRLEGIRNAEEELANRGPDAAEPPLPGPQLDEKNKRIADQLFRDLDYSEYTDSISLANKILKLENIPPKYFARARKQKRYWEEKITQEKAALGRLNKKPPDRENIEEHCGLLPIYFKRDESTLSPRQKEIILYNIACINSRSIAHIYLESHHGDFSEKYSIAISEKTGQVVKSYIVAQGTFIGQISVISKGKLEAKYSEDEAETRVKNRRIVFISG